MTRSRTLDTVVLPSELRPGDMIVSEWMAGDYMRFDVEHSPALLLSSRTSDGWFCCVCPKGTIIEIVLSDNWGPVRVIRQ